MEEEEEVESKAAGMKSLSQPPGGTLFLVLPLLSTLVAFTGASFSRGLRLYLGTKIRENRSGKEKRRVDVDK